MFNILLLVSKQPCFETNKYLNWYVEMIQNSVDRELGCNVYYERHHILPRSIFPNHKNDKWNIVKLTAREHFIAHKLLIKFTIGQAKYKMEKALIAFGMLSENRKLNSRNFQEARVANSKYNTGYRNPMFGKKHSKEHKEKLSKKTKGKSKPEGFGLKLSLTQKGKKKSKEHNLKNSLGHKGLKASDKTRAKLSEINTGNGNPKFKGYYIVEKLGITDTPCGFIEYGIPPNCLKVWCKYDNNRVISKKSYSKSKYLKANFSEDIIGKTFKELGFHFIPKEFVAAEDLYRSGVPNWKELLRFT